MNISEKKVWECLRTVIDPELMVDIVSLGLIYQVKISETQPYITITMTLTTPGCPLAGVFDRMVLDSLAQIKGLDLENDVSVELTFDPPWTPEMASEEVKAELGID